MGKRAGQAAPGARSSREGALSRLAAADSPGEIVRFIVTPADAHALEALGGADALGELLAELIERDGLEHVLRLLKGGDA